MYQIDVPTAAIALPPSTAPGVPGYFTDGLVATGTPPTIVPAEFLNAVMLEMLNVIVGGGLSPAKSSSGQLLLAIENLIEARSGNYAADVGAANAYVIALNPAIAAYTPGLTVKFRAAHANTGGSTLNAGPGLVPLLRDDGSALAPNDIGLSVIVSATYDAAAAGFLVNSIVPSQLGALAALGMGLGLESDGAGGVRVKVADTSLRRTAAGMQANEPVSTVGVAQNVTSANHFNNYQSSTAVAFSLAKGSTLWNGFCFAVSAKGGPVTLTPNATDGINGGAAGAAYVLNQGGSALFVLDDTGINWSLFFSTTGGSPSADALYQLGYTF